MAFLGSVNAAWRLGPSRTPRARVGSWRPRVVTVAFLLLPACKNPCDTLAERVCGDLDAADCQLWIADSSLSEGMLPLDDPARRRSSVAGPTCRKWLANETYESRTLPIVRERVARARRSGARVPTPLDGAAGAEPIASLPPLSQYALFPAALALIAFAVWFGHRKLRKVSVAPRGRLSTPPP